MGIKSEDSGSLLYLTDSPSKGRVAREAAAGLTVVIVRRPGNRLYKAADLLHFTVIDSLEQLAWFTATAVDGVDQF
mgnify:CR=1 FL=1